jgi:hypothetical protein
MNEVAVMPGEDSRVNHEVSALTISSCCDGEFHCDRECDALQG